MSEAAAWIAPIATMIAAMVTAANLGARVTGWGFVVFVIGSVSWSIVGMGSGQTNLLVTNAFLTVVNLIGVWRWLGRQARYDEGSRTAERQSRKADTPDLLSVGKIAGTRLVGRRGETIGVVVDAMMSARDGMLAYLVVSEGGVGGVGERLHAIDIDDVAFADDVVKCGLAERELAERRQLAPGDWPART